MVDGWYLCLRGGHLLILSAYATRWQLSPRVAISCTEFDMRLLRNLSLFQEQYLAYATGKFSLTPTI